MNNPLKASKLRVAIVAPAIAVSLLLSGCLQQAIKPQSTVVSTVGESVADELPPYNGPRARVAVTDFEWNAGSSSTRIGLPGGGVSYSIRQQVAHAKALKDMLTTALVQSKRYRVLERSRISSVKSEIELQESGLTDSSGVKKGSVQGTDIIVIASITGWAPGTSGTGGTVGGLLGGGAGALLGAVTGAKTKSEMSLDIRIVDANTTEVLAATSVKTEATDRNFGAALGALTGGGAMGGALGSYSRTPMEKAIRSGILEATKYIVENTPENYMKH